MFIPESCLGKPRANSCETWKIEEEDVMERISYGILWYQDKQFNAEHEEEYCACNNFRFCGRMISLSPTKDTKLANSID